MNYSPALAQSLGTAARVLGQMLIGKNVERPLEDVHDRNLRAAARDISFKVLRGYGFVDAALERLLDRPVRDEILRGLLLASIAELEARPMHAHAIVDQAVEAARLLGRGRAKGLVNAVLRNFQRQKVLLSRQIEASDTGRYRHPQWWIDRLRAAYPEQWEGVLLSANDRPPMTLRVNCRRGSVQAYLDRLAAAGIGARFLGGAAVLLERPCRVEALPGFDAGDVSVQDKGAQAAAPFLDVLPGMRVLDACAAPGGKTAHLLELADCDLHAVDISAERLGRLQNNLLRLGLRASLHLGDAADPASFWDGRPFDRILADVPCSASGVVRRHPDIRWLRRESDIAGFATTQRRMLDALWRLLRSGAKLLYATCSVYPEENGRQLRAFLEGHPDAVNVPLEDLPDGQILPGPDSDGFFYALLRRS